MFDFDSTTNQTKQLTQRIVRKCTPNAERLSNGVKSLIDKVMRGEVFQNPSAEGILAWLLCTDDLRNLLGSIPPWLYNGQGVGQIVTTDGIIINVTPQQAYFYQRITSVGGEELLQKLRTLQYGPASNAISDIGGNTLSDTIGSQQESVNAFKHHTDQQSGVGDPTTFMRTLGMAAGFDDAKQQMEGGNRDNFSTLFNSTIQGPIVVDQMRRLLCEPNSLGQLLARILDLIASSLPFSYDDIIALFGGLGIDDFFAQIDSIFSQMANLVDFLNYLVSLDFSRFQFAQAFTSKYTLGQFLAAIIRGEGRGNCITRGMLEQFTGNETLRGAISTIDIEKDKEERSARALARATTEADRQRASQIANNDKEIFFDEVPEDLVYRGFDITGPSEPITGSPDPEPTPPPIDPETLRLIEERLQELERKTNSLNL